MAKSNLKKFSEVKQVRFTGDWSSDSKLSAIQNGYWEDPFLSFFNTINPVPKRTSLICRGYFVRFRVCDFFLRHILSASESPIQVVSLGCGMDTTFFRLYPEYESKILKFIETDFESVIIAKQEVISRHETLQVMAKDKLVLVSSDLRDTESLANALRKAGVHWELPTLFYSECVVNYLRPRESDNILKWISANFANGIWLAYEQCNADDSFGHVMTKHFKKNGCPLLSIQDTPDIPTQLVQLKQAKFGNTYVMNVWDCFCEITKHDQDTYPRKFAFQHQFDEYEALLVTCLHYSVRIGINGCNISVAESIDLFQNKLLRQLKPEYNQIRQLSWTAFDTVKAVETTGQLSSCFAVSIGSDSCFLFGGYNGAFKRSTRLLQLQLDSEADYEAQQIADDSNCFERLAAAAVFHERSKSLYIFGGRRSPSKPCDPDIIQVQCKEPFVVKTLKFSLKECPPPRWRHSMGILQDKIFVFGGKNECGILDDFWIFDVGTGIWSSEKNILAPSARHSQSMCTDFNSQAYCVGGIGCDDKTICEDSVWRLQCGKELWKWSQLPELHVHGARVGHQTCLHNDHLLIFGGYGTNSKYSLNHFVTLVNLETLGVTCFTLKPEIPKLFLPFGFSCCKILMSRNNMTKILIYGGGGNCFSFGTVINEHMLVINVDTLLSTK